MYIYRNLYKFCSATPKVNILYSNAVKSISVVPVHFTGSPNCPTFCTTVNTTSLTVSIQKSQMTWLPEWYCVKAVSDNGSIASIVHSSTLNGSASFEVTSLEPDTVYNITVIPCNMAGCNESCDVHSVQTESEMRIEGETSKQNAPLYALLNQSVSHIHGGIESPMMEI